MRTKRPARKATAAKPTNDEKLSPYLRRHPTAYLEHLKETCQPIVLTINSSISMVVQDERSYQRLLELAERLEAVEGIRRGLEDVKHGRTQPAKEALEEIRQRQKDKSRAMSYRVEFSKAAKGEAQEAYNWIAQYSLARADRWFRGLLLAVDSLSDNPESCGLAPESELYDEEIRQLLYGKRRGVYRVLFTIRGDTIHVLHVIHSAKRFLEP